MLPKPRPIFGIREGVSLAVGLIAIASAYGTYSLLPYRVTENEKAIIEVKSKVDAITKNSATDHELLVRIDERLNQMQQTLKENSKPTKP